jgi:Undecaprenyl-phosphate galactose phosphotransferase WbaP
MWGDPAVIIGEIHKALSLARYFTDHPHFGIRPVDVFSGEKQIASNQNSNGRIQTNKIKEYARNVSVKTALVVVNDLNELDNEVDRFRFIFPRVILIKNQNGKFGLNSLTPLDFSGILGLQVKNNLLSLSSQVTKRTIDILVSFIGLILISPLLGMITLSIKIISPGRVFYRQKRLGKHGKEFTMLKFRTMHLDADRVLKAELERNPEMKKEWERYQKLKNDPRITSVGKYLRKFSLDELPQLWNVARGEMSLVGPRPIMMDQQEMYGQTINEYLQVRPGMTGLWQVSGRNGTSFARRAELDDEYIQRWSVWLDIYILLKTGKVVFWRNGAY